MKMKKSIKILLVLLCLTVIVGAFKAIVSAEDSAIESNEVMETEAVTEAVVEEAIDIGEVHEIVENSSSFAEAVIAIAERFGISIEDAEGLVADMKALGDKYLGESELWEVIKNDMAVNPQRYILIGLAILIVVAIIVLLIKDKISNMGQLRTLKINVASLRKSVDGDDSEDGKAFSLRSLITAKNEEIKALKEKNADLEAEVIKLREDVARLTKSIDEVKKNTTNALNIIQETALQIAQLLRIAMDNGKLPLMSKEAKQIWYEDTQMRIKAAAGIKEGGEPDASEKIQKA